ncbi:hypothetical protein ACFWZU_10325 [Frateuria sp. GZRR33]|uniref:hypothetical protein n=1 Tax=Frateuria sp. GZRR33 TaxID=3351535 RepID=UPI003EDBF39E
MHDPRFPTSPARVRVRRLLGTGLLLWLASMAAAATSTISNGSTDQLVGTWHGRSLCVTAKPACTDETVVYHIRRTRPHEDVFAIQADKIVAGREETIGDLSCRFEPLRQLLVCPMHGAGWRFRWDGSSLVGVLIDSDGSLFRVIQVQRSTTGPGRP